MIAVKKRCFGITMNDTIPMFALPEIIHHLHFVDQVFHFPDLYRDAEPFDPMPGLDQVPVPPVMNSILYIIQEDKFIDGLDHIKIAFPWYIVGL